MGYEKNNEVLSALHQMCQEKEIPARFAEKTPNEETDMVSMLAKLTDHMSMSSDIYCSDIGEGQYIVHLFSLIAIEVPDGPLEELGKASEYFNLYCPMGSYGIVRDERQFYHKHGILMSEDMEAEEAAACILEHMSVVFEIISLQCPLIGVLMSGSLDCETALRENLFLGELDEEE